MDTLRNKFVSWLCGLFIFILPSSSKIQTVEEQFQEKRKFMTIAQELEFSQMIHLTREMEQVKATTGLITLLVLVIVNLPMLFRRGEQLITALKKVVLGMVILLKTLWQRLAPNWLHHYNQRRK